MTTKINKAIFLIFALILIECTRKTITDDPIVAQVGDEVITVSQFKMNYEFGLAHLKKGPNPKRAYLDFMVKEMVLSRQGYNLGLDKADAVQNAVNRLEEELLIEELFIDQVHSRIKVSDDEIREALNKSKVSWKFRYWVEPTFEGAAIVADAMRERGFADVVEDFLSQNSESPLTARNFESDYVSWLDVPEELLNAIKDLPRGEISAPLALNGVYFIIQLTDIRRQGILESEYADKAESMKQILFYRKVMDEGVKFVADFMTPKQVVTKGENFRILSDALDEWKKQESDLSFLETIKSASKEDEELFALQKILSETLAQFKTGKWSLEEYVKNYLDAAELTANPEDKSAFRTQLNNMIGLSIRNYFLLKEARRRKLTKSENLQAQLVSWRDKWVYQETRYNYTKDLSVSSDQVRAYFEDHKQKYKIRKDKEPTFGEFKNQAKQDAYLDHARNILSTKIDSLVKYIPVRINESVLDTTSVQESIKSKWMSVQLFKRSSNRLLFPIVDPAWGF